MYDNDNINKSNQCSAPVHHIILCVQKKNLQRVPYTFLDNQDDGDGEEGKWVYIFY